MSGEPLRPDPPAEYFKPLQRYRDPAYFRKRGPRGVRGRTLAALAVAAAGLVWVGAEAFGPRGHTVFQSRRVSVSHASLNDKCSSCHTAGFATAERFMLGNDSVRSVGDKACVQCHEGPVHHDNQAGPTACAGCHAEHRGRESLSRVANGHCTACHAGLAAHTAKTPAKPPGGRDFHDVTSFAPFETSGEASRGHPEFALWSGSARDPGTLRFNHQKHLAPEGVLVLGSQDRAVLSCADCHEPDADRRYMKPVTYEQSCVRCHRVPFKISGNLSGLDPKLQAAADAFAAGPAAHPGPGGSARSVQADLRQRLVDFLAANPGATAVRPGLGPNRAFPGASESGAAGPTGPAWVEEQLARLDVLAFDSAEACRFCHQETGRDPDGVPRVAPPAVPRRWFPHAKFSHDGHRNLDCRRCHGAAETSSASSDVMLPDVAVCQACHAPAAGAARPDCVECHTYHDRTRERMRTPSGPVEAHFKTFGKGPATPAAPGR